MLFSERLEEQLKKNHITWKEVSERLSIGRNQKAYWAKQDTLPGKKTLQKLADFFHVTPDYLAGRDVLEARIMTDISNMNNAVTITSKNGKILATARTVRKRYSAPRRMELSPSEIELLMNYRMLDPSDKKKILNLLKNPDMINESLLTQTEGHIDE